MKANEYTIDLLAPNVDGKEMTYHIDDAFFQNIDGLVQRGQVTTLLHIEGSARSVFRFHFHSEGTVFAPCDRCLADVEIPIDVDDTLTVKLGEEYADEGECIIIPESEGVIDVSQFIYELIALSLPMKLVHEDGLCDEAMMAKLEQLTPVSPLDEE